MYITSRRSSKQEDQKIWWNIVSMAKLTFRIGQGQLQICQSKADIERRKKLLGKYGGCPTNKNIDRVPPHQ